jgi:hypothetical protein
MALSVMAGNSGDAHKHSPHSLSSFAAAALHYKTSSPIYVGVRCTLTFVGRIGASFGLPAQAFEEYLRIGQSGMHVQGELRPLQMQALEKDDSIGSRVRTN